MLRILIILLMVTGCTAKNNVSEVDENQDHRNCKNLGFRLGTPEFIVCTQRSILLKYMNNR